MGICCIMITSIWRNTAPKDGGLGKIDFPLVADVNHSIMTAYGIVHPAGIALRASFLFIYRSSAFLAKYSATPSGVSFMPSSPLFQPAGQTSPWVV
jgi:hypothetical protein